MATTAQLPDIDVLEHFVEAGDFSTHNDISIKKYKSVKSGLSVYFCNVDSQIINGYFAFGTDQPEASGIEPLLWQLDSSGGLLPRTMRGDMLRAAWQLHGAENPLADRDQSSYVCCALGETAFLGTFSCSMYLLQNLEAVFIAQGLLGAGMDAGRAEAGACGGAEGEDRAAGGDTEAESEISGADTKLQGAEGYCLSEAGEGAMAWETTLQEMFSGARPFLNRILTEGRHKLDHKMRACYDKFYRPENLTVVIVGTIEDRAHILETLYEYEADYYADNAETENPPQFVRPWSGELPPFRSGVETTVQFIPRNLARKPNATLCFGWRGCPSTDVETYYALKVITAYASVGPLWNKFITPGIGQRISWCLLEYVDTCTLITVHGAKSLEEVEAIIATMKDTFKALAAQNDELMQLKDVRAMTERVCWHCIRELESEPALVLASCITKAERYGLGEPDQLQKRLQPNAVFDELLKKDLGYWKELVAKYFISNGTFVTKLIPKSFEGGPQELPIVPDGDSGFQSEASSAASFTNISRRASSRPRSRSANDVEEISNAKSKADPELKAAEPTELDKSLQNLTLGTKGEGDRSPTATPALEGEEFIGHIEQMYREQPNQFPFGDYSEAAEGFEERLTTTALFLEQVVECDIRNHPVTQYYSDGAAQHPKFPVTDLPFYTFLDDTTCSFVYLTSVMDTSHLDEMERNHVAIIASALGAVLCPRPPDLDTDADIKSPNEFNPPLLISDSQVSLGLNGEMMQNIFSTLIARPEHYKWAVGMMKYVLYDYEFSPSFLSFVCAEAAKGLAYNYRMQTIDEPKYEYFDASEINLYSLIKMMYKKESNARLFVGRRRLDLVNEFSRALATDPEATTKALTATWRKIVDGGRVTFQIACNVSEIAARQNPLEPWTEYFKGVKQESRARDFESNRPTPDQQLINLPGPSSGISVAVKHCRPACLTLAIPIDPTADYFPALCVCMQVFSMAQKWIWFCIDEEEPSQPALRMPCSFANIVTLSLESADLIGVLKIMKGIIMRDDWEWLNTLLVATKLMLVNDPTTNEMGPQGAIALTLLTNLVRQPVSVRRDLMIKCLKVSLDQVKSVIRDHLSRLFDPAQGWCALMAEAGEHPKLVERLQSEFGFQFKEEDLVQLCSTL